MIMAGYDRYTAEGQRFLKELDNLSKLSVRVGYQAGEATDDNGVDLCDIAMWNELGTSGKRPIPSRPFLRKTVDENQDKIDAFCSQQANTLTKGGTAEDVLKKIGVFSKGLVQEKIASGSYEPNAPSTISKKKSDKPLIDTGRLRQSVSYTIKSKGDA